MKKTPSLNFSGSKWNVTGLSMVLIVGVGLMFALVLEGWSRIDQMRDEIETIEHRIEQRKRTNERETLRQKRLSPEERHIDQMLLAQSMNTSGSGLSVIDWIEHAWTPDIGLKSIAVDKAGRQARIDGGAATLAQIYIFVDRLRGQHPDRDVGLLQHHLKVEDGRNIHHFTLSIEHP